MYRCEECKAIMDEDDVIKERTSAESYYGVSDLFPDSHSMTIWKCPHCGSESIEDYTPPKRYESDEELIEEVSDMLDYDNSKKVQMATDISNGVYTPYIEELRNTFDIDEEDVRAALIYMGDIEDDE